MNAELHRLPTPPRKIVLTAVTPRFVICRVEPAGGGFEQYGGHFASPGAALDFALGLAEELGFEVAIWTPAKRLPAS